MRKPIDMYFGIVDEKKIERGSLEIQTDDYGNVVDVFVAGVCVEGMVDVREFVELLLSQSYLFTRADNARMDRLADEMEAAKKAVELEMERKAGA